MPQTSIFRSPIFWGGVAAAAVGVGVVLHKKRMLLGRSAGPTPVFVAKNPAKMPVPTETRHINGETVKRFDMKTMSIDERLKLIQKQVWNGIQDPRIRKLAGNITAGCGRDDGECEVRTIFDAVKKQVRYSGDISDVINPQTGEVTGIDLYQSPYKSWEYRVADCDDHVSLIASLLAVIGNPVRLRVSAPSRWSEFSHIYPVVGTPKGNPKKWRAVDVTLPWGNAAPGSESRFGKARDYQIEVPA